ncbi:hypothetical protein IAT40_004623 [Kwoniella sp. CBS 6097]
MGSTTMLAGAEDRPTTPPAIMDMAPTKPFSGDQGVLVLERILWIVLNIDRKALTACARVSRHFHSIASPILYSRIRLGAIALNDSRRDASDTDGDLSKTRARQYDPVTFDRKKRLLQHASVVRVDAHFYNFCKINDTSPEFNKIKREFGRHFGNHSGGTDDVQDNTESVDDVHSLQFPKMKTLVIYPIVQTVPEETAPYFHAKTQLDRWRPTKVDEDCSVTATLARALGATQQGEGLKKIVLHTIVINRFDLFPTGLPKDTYDNIDQLTLVAPMINFRFSNTSPSTLPALPNLKKLVFIFKTPEPKMQWKMGTHTMFGWGGLHDFFSEDLRTFVDLVWQLDDPTTQVYIINADWLYHLHVGLYKGATSEAVQEAFKQEFCQSLSYSPYTVKHDLGHTWPFSDSEDSDDGLTKEQKMDKRMMEEVAASMAGNLRAFKEQKRWEEVRKDMERAERKRNRPERHQREKDEKERLKIKLKNIHFITMEEYIANHDWEGELDPADIVKWRKAQEQVSISATASSKAKGKGKGKRKQEPIELEVEVELKEDDNLHVRPSSSKRVKREC